MRVLWIIDSLGPGGAEGLMPSLLENLTRLGVQSQVCVLQSRLGNPVALELEKRGISVNLVQVDNLRSFSQIKCLFQYIANTKPDIIHTQLETSDTLGCMIARILKIPSVSTLHTLSVPSQKRTSRFRNFMRRFSLRFFCNKIIAVSEVTRKHFISLGMKPEKVITLHNGISVERFQHNFAEMRAYRKELGFDDGDFVLVTVAVLREQKGIQNMIRAIPSLLNKFPNVRYAIVGDGDYRNPLEELANLLHVDDKISFLGYRNNIPEVLAASDLFVFPTLNDALPTVLLEAMATGLPIVASRVGGVPEIIVDGQSGLLVQPGEPSLLVDACTRLLDDRDFANALGIAGHEVVVQRFDINRQLKNLKSLYHQLVEKERAL